MKLTLDYAPKYDGEEFNEWCDKYGFTPFASGRRAWCNQFATYFRGAAGVATTPNGEQFLFDHDEIANDILQIQVETYKYSPDNPDHIVHED